MTRKFKSLSPAKKLAGISAIGAVAITGFVASFYAQAQDQDMTFFITSAGPGNGGDLGGLEGADAYCASLASESGSELENWKAYLSVNAMIDRSGDQPKVIPGVDARDRIGAGPWHNSKGELIASNLEDLHSDANGINLETGLDEKGDMVNGRGQQPNRHDIITGSTPTGQYSTAGGDTSCCLLYTSPSPRDRG